MAVHRIAPKCEKCGKPNKAINDVKKALDGFIGDIFIRWEKDCFCENRHDRSCTCRFCMDLIVK